jgi:D-alanyl-D-alanine carboxypeptidase-like protein
MGGSIGDLVDELQPFARALVDAAGSAGLQPRVTSTVRTSSEQRRLYNRFLAGQAGYPVVPPGFSAHEYGLAFDLVVSPMDALADVGYTWKQWGGGWSPTDAVHFELPGASQWAAEQGRAQAGGRVGETVRSWADWFADLPWYVQVLMPLSTMTASKQMTFADVQRVAKRFGVNL